MDGGLWSNANLLDFPYPYICVSLPLSKFLPPSSPLFPFHFSVLVYKFLSLSLFDPPISLALFPSPFVIQKWRILGFFDREMAEYTT